MLQSRVSFGLAMRYERVDSLLADLQETKAELAREMAEVEERIAGLSDGSPLA